MIDPKLKTLLSVEKEGSFTRAAEVLALSQPAVSYHIRQLEAEYAIKIFYRTPQYLPRHHPAGAEKGEPDSPPGGGWDPAAV